MKKYGALLFVLLILVTSLYSQSAGLTQKQKQWLEKANSFEKDGWIYLHIEGSPEERGFQHGYLLSKEIKESLHTLAYEWHYRTSMDWAWLVKKAGDMFTPKVDAEDLAEIDGIVEGLKAAGVETTRDELVAMNGSMELGGYWWPSIKDSLKINSDDPMKENCSSFIATGSMTADGGVVLGHNTMTGYQEPFCNVIMDIKPDKGHRILMQTSAGWIHSGTDFFITDAGLVGSETTIGDFYPFDEKGVPEFSRMLHATQYANNIDEWCDSIKKGNNGGYANAWLIGDINTNEIARLELGLKYVGFERTKDGFFIGSNVAENLKILRKETKANELNIKQSSVARRVRWKQLMKENAGKINVELAEKMEADHYDTYLNRQGESCRDLCAHWDLDPQTYGMDDPYSPDGTVDAKVVDTKMAKQMSFAARWGAACGTAFDAKKFLEQHPQYFWVKDILKDRPSQPWAVFTINERK